MTGGGLTAFFRLTVDSLAFIGLTVTRRLSVRDPCGFALVARFTVNSFDMNQSI
jgi:hypothetical protein